jgi:hypothetical protein
VDFSKHKAKPTNPVDAMRQHLHTEDDLLHRTQAQYLIDKLVVEDSVCFIYAPPASFKSFVVLDWLLCVVSGIPWHGHDVTPGDCMYIAAEGYGGFGKRWEAWKMQHNRLKTPSPNTFHIMDRAINLMDVDDVNTLISMVRAVQSEYGLNYRIICIDTFAKSMRGGEENSAKDTSMAIASCDKIRTELGVTVLVVHHTGKDVGRKMRGSNATEAGANTVIRIDRGEEGDRDNLMMTVEKQKDDEDGQRFHFRAKRVDLIERDTPGWRRESSLVMEPSVKPGLGRPSKGGTLAVDDDDEDGPPMHAGARKMQDTAHLIKLAGAIVPGTGISLNDATVVLGRAPGSFYGKLRKLVPVAWTCVPTDAGTRWLRRNTEGETEVIEVK